MQIGKNKILELYPSVEKSLLEKAQFALCPFKIRLPQQIQNEIEQVCIEFLTLKKSVSSSWEDSVLNSLDFHYSDENLKIIEANTNASGYLLSHLLLEAANTALDYEHKIFESFEKKAQKKLHNVLIADENPKSEKMYIEFLMFKDFFERHGVRAQIIATQDVADHSPPPDLVYNRDTDFELQKHPQLHRAWKENKLSLSTSPLSYKNLASKAYSSTEQRTLKNSSWTSLKTATLNTQPLHKEHTEELWTKRKKLFFKPSESFGSKGVYAGKSISHKKFLSLGTNYIAQEAHPPGKVREHDQTWKFDLRAFFSEAGVQKIIARVYQGQVTNFANLGGGFALIEWIE